jgi:hypothetical protein
MYMLSLKNVLLINAVSSGATGIGLVVLAETVANLFGTTAVGTVMGVGIFLVVFAAGVLNEAVQRTARLTHVYIIIALDILWVIGSIAIVLPQLFNLSAIGYIAITAVALWVAAMAYLQIKGVNQTAAV